MFQGMNSDSTCLTSALASSAVRGLRSPSLRTPINLLVFTFVLGAADIADAIRQIGVSEVTYYRWRQEYGGLKTEQVKRLKELETENARLRKAISDLTLDKLILQEAARGNF